MEPFTLEWAATQMGANFALSDTHPDAAFFDFLQSEAKGICLDTRRGAQDALFFALAGEHTDGHHYVPQAFAAGAAGAVVSRSPGDVPGLLSHFVPRDGAAIWMNVNLPIHCGSLVRSALSKIASALFNAVAQAFSSPPTAWPWASSTADSASIAAIPASAAARLAALARSTASPEARRNAA